MFTKLWGDGGRCWSVVLTLWVARSWVFLLGLRVTGSVVSLVMFKSSEGLSVWRLAWAPCPISLVVLQVCWGDCPERTLWAPCPIRLCFPSGLADVWPYWPVSLPSQPCQPPHTGFFSLRGPFSPTHQFSYCSWGRSLSCLYCFGPEGSALWQPPANEQLTHGLIFRIAFSKRQKIKNNSTTSLYLIGCEGTEQSRVFDIK